MTIGWADLAFRLDHEAAQVAADEWGWLIAEPWTPLLCSAVGGVFLEKESGGVFWLECGAGEIERVADSTAAFDAFLGGPRDDKWAEKVDWWFLPPLVRALHEAGKRPGPGQCYGAKILPIFEGGKLTVDNMFVASASEWLGYTGSIHRQLSAVPDQTTVRLVKKN